MTYTVAAEIYDMNTNPPVPDGFQAVGIDLLFMIEAEDEEQAKQTALSDPRFARLRELAGESEIYLTLVGSSSTMVMS